MISDRYITVNFEPPSGELGVPEQGSASVHVPSGDVTLVWRERDDLTHVLVSGAWKELTEDEVEKVVGALGVRNGEVLIAKAPEVTG